MESKKQLLFIPPMSGPLQKLNEVLTGIAEEENIEISVIDDLRELMQFIGSTGQCLIAFSNAKKCATFLQENRFLIAKTHSKVILLTPKEIPTKTLSKFTKIGLTESILENSSPKTLLYKVKLLLRSIKVQSASDDKELAIKTIDGQLTKENSLQDEIRAEKIQNEEVTLPSLGEERTKFTPKVEAPDPVDSLEKRPIQESKIEMHWKSRREKDDVSPQEADLSMKAEMRNSSEIDMYYRGKKKDHAFDIIETDEIKKRKNKQELQEELDDSDDSDGNSIHLDLVSSQDKEKRRKELEEEAEGYLLKKSKNSFEEEPTENTPFDLGLDEENDEERKHRELMELEALFEEAKKRQAHLPAQDLGGHYKGKLKNTNIAEDETEEEEEREDYDNSDLYRKKKSSDLILAPGDEEDNNPRQVDEVEAKKAREGFTEEIAEDLASAEGKTDHIETLMKSKFGLDRNKEIANRETKERKRTEAVEEQSPENPRDLEPAAENAKSDSQRANKKQSEALTESDQSIDLDISPAPPMNSSTEGPLSEEKQSEQKKAKNLNLENGDGDAHQRSADSEEDLDPHQKSPPLAPTKEKQKERTFEGKTDKIDGFLRGGEAQKKDQDWNLNEKNSKFDLAIEKKKRSGEEFQEKVPTNHGEQTIDYRQMKEEFEALARLEDGNGLGLSEALGERNKEENEEASFKVIEPNAAGVDFAVEFLNMIDQKEVKPQDFFKSIAEEMSRSYQAWPVFYTFRSSETKHSEVFDSILKLSTQDELRQWWMEHKNEEAFSLDVQAKTMPTWICREMNWEDVELPVWAAHELKNKRVELAYPYADGLDRMGLAVVYFPQGINPLQVRSIEMTLEMARCLLLDTIQRKKGASYSEENSNEAQEHSASQKKTFLNLFTGFFGKEKKAG